METHMAGLPSFSDPDAVARYAEGPVRMVPGFHALQRMAGVLLAERAGDDAHILVLGAGGGLELKVFADMQPGWRFCGVDPSAEMLDLARQTLGPLGARVTFHHGYIDNAPEGPFDGATCLLTLHFLPEQERRRAVAEVYRRLKPGAPFIVAHHSFPQEEPAKTLWLSRFAAFGPAPGLSFASREQMIAAISEKLPALSPQQDEEILRDAGFADVALFYAGFTFRGWVGCKA
jgi:tRNA (cmo5U34)-methyltransferase